MRNEAGFIKTHGLNLDYQKPEGYTVMQLTGMGRVAMIRSGMYRCLVESAIDGDKVLGQIALNVGIVLSCDFPSKSAAERLYSFAEEMGVIIPELKNLTDATLKQGDVMVQYVKEPNGRREK